MAQDTGTMYADATKALQLTVILLRHIMPGLRFMPYYGSSVLIYKTGWTGVTRMHGAIWTKRFQ